MTFFVGLKPIPVNLSWNERGERGDFKQRLFFSKLKASNPK
jgi:hypothetical protein